MSLSNTATPIYYGKFREEVMAGRILVNREISQEMNRIDALIRNPAVFYDDQAINGFIAFCENECTLTDGSDLTLLDSFKLWAEQVYGWYYFVDKSVFEPNPDGYGGHYVQKRIKKRLIKKQYLIVARGAAKSMYASLIQFFELVVNASTTFQITTAPTMKQADEVMSPIRTALTRARGPLLQVLTAGSVHNTNGNLATSQKVSSTKKGIENFLTGSILEVRPMSIDKLQGSRAFLYTIDEWLSGATRADIVGTCEQSGSKNSDYLIICTSSEGTTRNGPGDTIKMELEAILRGEYVSPHTSIWYYKLDDVKEVADPRFWIKANPNLGKTIEYEAYQLDVERAEKNPSARNDILAKRFGLPMEGSTYFFTYQETLVHPNREYWNMTCSLGADLSQGDDFCAFCFLFPLRNGEFGVKVRSYISSRTLHKLPGAMRAKYEEFIQEGSLVVFEGTVLDMMEVYDELDRYIEFNRYDVRVFGYDPYNAREFEERWEQENGPFGIEKVRQGKETETVPLGELKKLASDRALLFDQLLMQFCMGNAMTLEDTNGNRKLLKMRYEAKIDNVSAMMDAYYAYKLHKELLE